MRYAARALLALLPFLLPVTVTAQTVPPCGAQYTWKGLSNASMARYGHTAVWTGSEMIVWGGKSGDVLRNDGARFDPLRGTWQSMAMSPLGARIYHTAVWTGEEMIIWGGSDNLQDFKDGARYNPRNDTWTPMAVLPGSIYGRSRHAAVWTGSRFVIWGGVRSAYPAYL